MSTNNSSVRVNVKQLAEEKFDLLVVGAGIYGSALACRAAQAGLRVALIDKGDYGEGTSANSLKILHGGLRYLQQMNIDRMRESIKARRDGLASLPHLARPAPFLAPSGSSLKRSRAAFRVASILYDAISRDRNDGVRETHAIPGTQVLSKDEVKTLIPDAEIPGSGAMLWHDGFIENTERYTLSYIMTAKQLGAVTANYVRATKLLQPDNHQVNGVKARDEETGSEFDILAAMTVNACGPWITDLMPCGSAIETPSTWVRAYNIVVKRNWFGKYGVGLDNSQRSFFFAPWRGGTIIGTAYDTFNAHADACKLTGDDIATFVKTVNELYPQAKLKISDVSFAHAGVLPAEGGQPSGDTKVIDYGIIGYLAILGVKYTTGAFWADKVTETILTKLEKKRKKKPGHLYITPATSDDLAYFVSNEDALHLTDILFRRTDLGTFASPDAKTVSSTAETMKLLLNWREEQKEAEISKARNHYERLGITVDF